MDRFENLHPGYAIHKNVIYSGETLREPVNGVTYMNYSDIASYLSEKEKFVPDF